MIKKIFKQYDYHIIGKHIYIGKNKDIEIEILEDRIEIFFWGFENTIWRFNYVTNEMWKNELYRFLRVLLKDDIKIETYFVGAKKVKAKLYIKEDGGWIKITSSTNLRYIFRKKKKTIEIIDTKQYKSSNKSN